MNLIELHDREIFDSVGVDDDGIVLHRIMMSNSDNICAILVNNKIYVKDECNAFYVRTNSKVNLNEVLGILGTYKKTIC